MGTMLKLAIAYFFTLGIADDWPDWNGWSTTSAESIAASTATATTSSIVAATTAISSTSCQLNYTTTITDTKTVAELTSYDFSTTVTVPPAETRTVIILAGTPASLSWLQNDQSFDYIQVDAVAVPTFCFPYVTTRTEHTRVTQIGSTRTITGSTLFVENSDGSQTTVTITLGSSSTAVTSTMGPFYSNNTFLSAPETILATGSDAFTWNETTIIPQPSLSEAPAYTSLSDGRYGVITNSSSNVGSTATTSTSAEDQLSSAKSGSNDDNNGTVIAPLPQPGGVASNVTAPSPSLADTSCNTAGDRKSWCDDRSIETDYYEEYISGNICHYDFTMSDEVLNLDGSNVPVLAVNGRTPGPIIECNWGDVVSVTVRNGLLANGTSLHWHGIRQAGTNNMDGVPGITECPLAPGESRTYTWLASAYGTSWYHSHWATQYGDGLYGPIVIHGPASANYDIDAGVVLISDTFPTSANLYNSIITHKGPKGTTNYLLNGHNTKADLSAGQHSLWKVQKGKRYRFRFVNSASQNMWSISVDNHQMQVIAADFTPIVPYTTSWLNIGIGQRYDVVIEMDQDVDSYFLRAVTQLLCPSSCNNTGLGQANGIIAYEGVSETPYLLPTSTTDKVISDFDICNDEPLASLVPYIDTFTGSLADFSSKVATLPAGSVKVVTTNDDGNVVRWYLNGGAMDLNFTQPTLLTLAQQGNESVLVSNYITLPTGNIWVYFVIQNSFVAGHPMHLHGHDFHILGQGLGQFNSSLINTLNFATPMRRDTAMLMGRDGGSNEESGYTVIGFETNNPGAWLMHCHIIWHVEAGLSLQWLELPDEIPAQRFCDSNFTDNCAVYTAYEAESPSHDKLSWESGVKL